MAIALVAISGTASGQSSSVRGVIFDSVAKIPLAGATVQIVKVTEGAQADDAQRNYTATTDSVGKFPVDGIPKGKFGIGFQHSASNGLGLESPALPAAVEPQSAKDLACARGRVDPVAVGHGAGRWVIDDDILE